MILEKKYFLLFILLVSTLKIFAQNEIGPDGDKLIWFFAILLLGIVIFFIFRILTGQKRKPLYVREKVKVSLQKDRLYYPDNVKMELQNIGNTDIDIDRPLLVFDNFWLKRKFRLKGTDGRTFYPLYLDKNKVHHLNIDLSPFYSYDKKLIRYPKLKVLIFNVKGKRLGKSVIYLRKTLIRF
ncbi:MAG: hypothetical protein FD181_1776 [Prolixibacteraceae bacterium]|nr:MAG: hypothetical protein FD181_1776 [Prolixibacteraceae bacterium]